MKCAFCQSVNDRVIDTRTSRDESVIRRRRQCMTCKQRFTTYERIDLPIHCPFCHGENSRLIETRTSQNGLTIERTRGCLACKREYTTHERLDMTIKCPFCRGDKGRLIQSRASQDGSTIQRTRECARCKRRYTTHERVEGTAIKIVKKDGAREPFDRSKVKRGLEKACWKRPVSDAQLEAVITAVENEIEANFESEVESSHLGKLVMQQLRQLDQVAYVRFASVYRQFKDLHDFVSELKPMLDESRRPR